ncbi:MAG: amino acid ABC transporter substrate-binding protein, partial [Anaerolineales bacterium]|nr:amino acid ABC transporter substrate-binding protein [Anaerolineales bacterium]
MKMRRAILIILALMVAILVACTRRDPTPTPVPPTKAPTAVPLPTNTVAPPATEAPPGDQAWARIQTNGRMIVGTAADYPPFEFYTSSFLLDGFDIALMRAIGDKMGVQIEFRDIAFDGLGGALQVDQIDAAISAISVNTDRAEFVDFSNIYLITEDAVVAANDSPYTITGITDLAEFRVGVQRLSVYEDWLRDNLVDEELMEPTNLFVYQNANEIQTALTEGEIDVAVVDRPVAEVAAQAGDYKIIGQGLYPQRLAIAMKQDSPTLQTEINRVLGELQLDGTVAQLALQYLTIERLPPITDPTPPTGGGGENVAC